MIDITTISDLDAGLTLKLFRAEAQRRNWKIEVPYVGSAHFIIQRDGKEDIHIFSSTPHSTSYAAGKLANDKYATYTFLIKANIVQPETVMVGPPASDASLEAKGLLNRHGLVVVKPIDGGHGQGVTVGVADVKELEAAIQYARLYTTENNAVIVQEQFQTEELYDIRILCVDYEFTAAILRVPASVSGNGIHTIRQLIEMENKKPERGRPYYQKYATIDVERAENYLGTARMNTVPEEGEEVPVLGIANYGAGGDTIDVTDDIPGWLKEEAIRAARCLELPVAGIDYLLSKAPSSSFDRSRLRSTLIEVNKCPSLIIHDAPTKGESRNVTAQYFDYLERISKD